MVTAPGRDVVHDSACASVVRRFAGVVADELAVLCRPQGRSVDTPQQAAAVYRDLAGRLASQQTSFHDLAGEMLFLRDVRRDLPAVLEARARVLADLGQSSAAPQPTFIQQAPIEPEANVELLATAVIPSDRRLWAVRDVAASASCACKGCTQSAARIVQLGEQTALYTTNVYGAGDTPAEQAAAMFVAAERLLAQSGMEFRDVVRTWIYLRDIDRDYDALNRARREFFQSRGITLRPASTGVQGIPFPEVHDVSMSLYAVRAKRLVDVASMSTPTLNEAWSYGADFSRGVRVAEANKVAIYVSGTASIDEAGHTIHVGDFMAQAQRMLGNIASLLAEQGAGFADLMSGVVYLKDPNDAALLRRLCRERGFEGFPCAMVEAPLCRADLLCEAEAVAVLPVAFVSGGVADGPHPRSPG